MNKNIIIAILVVIIIAAVATIMFAHPQQTTTADGKLNTEIKFIDGSKFKNGDIVQFELKDAKGNPIANQSVNITFMDEGQKQNYSVLTDNSGKAGLALNNEKTGDHEVTVTYGGNNKYNGCSAKQTITIEDGKTTDSKAVSGNSTASTAKYNGATSNSSSTSNSQSGSQNLSEGPGPNLYYDEELNVWYDDYGIVRGGQSDGSHISDLFDAKQYADEHGQL